MTIREVGWTVFLVGLPFAHFLFRPLDLWHGQAIWSQGWILALFALSLGSDGRKISPNRPLAAFIAWIGLVSLWMWVHTMTTQKIYPVPMLQGLMHLVLLLLAYQAAVTTWTTEFIGLLTRRMVWVGVAVIGYGLLQLMNLDQFLNSLEGTKKDELVGTIGNPTHLSAQMSLLAPLLLLWCPWALIGVLVIFSVTQSLGGQLACLVALAWWGWHQERKWLWVAGGLSLLGGLWVWLHPGLLNPHGRLKAWGIFYQMFQSRPITGLGPGSIMEFSRTITDGTNFFYGWRHVHNEFFQAAIEYGVIGLGLILWMCWDIGRTIHRLKKTPLVVALSGTLIAFGVNSLVNFPAHLWLLGSYALVAYCGLKVIEAETVQCQ